MKCGFVYLWFDRKHKRYYVGCHWGTTDDGYICSSSWMMQAYYRRPEDFKRRILKNNLTREELFDEEFKWLQKAEKKKTKYYNLHFFNKKHWIAGSNSEFTILKIKESWKKRKGVFTIRKGKKFSKEHKNNLSLAAKNKPKVSDLTRMKMSRSRIGKICSNETKNKISKSNKGKSHVVSKETKQKLSLTNSGKNNPFYNKKHSTESKQKMKEKKLGVIPWNKNKNNIKMQGTKFYNNGVIQKMFKQEDAPIDWVPGRLK